MPWIRFKDDFDWEPPEAKGRTVIAYKAGTTKLVRKECAADAVAAGAGAEVRKPAKARPTGAHVEKRAFGATEIAGASSDDAETD